LKSAPPQASAWLRKGAGSALYWMTGNVLGVDGGEMMGARREGS
jgi:hypothetical protein